MWDSQLSSDTAETRPFVVTSGSVPVSVYIPQFNKLLSFHISVKKDSTSEKSNQHNEQKTPCSDISLQPTELVFELDACRAKGQTCCRTKQT